VEPVSGANAEELLNAKLSRSFCCSGRTCLFKRNRVCFRGEEGRDGGGVK
jgi:hypothetical protein